MIAYQEGGSAYEYARHPEHFCPRCQMRFDAETPKVGTVCSLCAAEGQIGRVLNTSDFE